MLRTGQTPAGVVTIRSTECAAKIRSMPMRPNCSNVFEVEPEISMARAARVSAAGCFTKPSGQ
jgi:hypothetical protein